MGRTCKERIVSLHKCYNVASHTTMKLDVGPTAATSKSVQLLLQMQIWLARKQTPVHMFKVGGVDLVPVFHWTFNGTKGMQSRLNSCSYGSNLRDFLISPSGSVWKNEWIYVLLSHADYCTWRVMTGGHVDSEAYAGSTSGHRRIRKLIHITPNALTDMASALSDRILGMVRT